MQCPGRLQKECKAQKPPCHPAPPDAQGDTSDLVCQAVRSPTSRTKCFPAQILGSPTLLRPAGAEQSLCLGDSQDAWQGQGQSTPEPCQMGYKSHGGTHQCRGTCVTSDRGRDRSGAQTDLGQRELPAALPPGSPITSPQPSTPPGGKSKSLAQLPAPPLQPLLNYRFTSWKLLTGKFSYQDTKVL